MDNSKLLASFFLQKHVLKFDFGIARIVFTVERERSVCGKDKTNDNFCVWHLDANVESLSDFYRLNLLRVMPVLRHR